MFLRKLMALTLAATLLSVMIRAQDNLPELSARAAAALNTSPDAIEITTVGHRTTLTGITFAAVKVMWKTTGDTIGLYLGADGSVGDESLFASPPEEIPLFERRTSPLLRERFAQNEGLPQRLAIWLITDPEKIDFRDDMQTAIDAGIPVEEARAALRSRLEAANFQTVDSAITALRGMGYEILYADQYAPVVFTNATADQVAQLVELPIVDYIYPSLEYQSELRDQITTHRWDRVHNFGVWGQGVKVAIVEDDGISNTHPDLNVVGYFSSNLNIGAHATACAGILGSRNTTYPGHARGVQLYSGNSQSYIDSQLTAATSWAIAQGVDIVSMSFGFDTNRVIAFLDRYVDYQVRFTATTFVKSAGNRGTSDGDVTSPGLGFNILTVGNFDEHATADWDDDNMASSSSYGDPVSTFNDREKPEIAAVGTSVTTADLSNGFSNQGTGTSYSAPAVAGMTACFMQMQSTLKSSPEAVRAILMAGATHNIEGFSRLSEFDGAGGINGLQAYRIVQQRHFATGTFQPSSFSTTGFYVFNLTLQAGDRTRICMAWNSNVAHVPPFFNYSSDTLQADFDIAVFAGASVISGSALAISASYDNSYEIVEFVPPITGVYTLRINDFRFDGSSEQFGIAWTQHADGRYVRFRESLPDVTSNDLVGPCIGNQFYGLYPYDSVNSGGSVYCIASAGKNIGVSLADGRHSYGDLDALASFSIDPTQNTFNGFFGTYNPSTSFPDLPGLHDGYHVNLPDLPALVGYPLYFTALTIEGGHPSAIKEISELKEIEIQSHAQNLTLSDDSSVPVLLPFSFPFFGQLHSICYVGSNGNVTFGAPDTDFTESATDLASGPPRICAFWDDLNPSLGGVIRVRQSSNQFIIEWVNVPQFGTTSGDNNSAMLILHKSGRIEVKFRDCTLQDAIVGVSPGGNSTIAELDLSSGFQFGLYGGAVYEQFNGTGGSESMDLDTTLPGFLSLFFVDRKTVSFTPQTNIFFGTRYLVEVDL